MNRELGKKEGEDAVVVGTEEVSVRGVVVRRFELDHCVHVCWCDEDAELGQRVHRLCCECFPDSESS